MFKNDSSYWTDDEYEVLNDLSGDVDAFCDDPVLRGPNDVDEMQLKNSARVALEAPFYVKLNAHYLYQATQEIREKSQYNTCLDFQICHCCNPICS